MLEHIDVLPDHLIKIKCSGLTTKDIRALASSGALGALKSIKKALMRGGVNRQGFCGQPHVCGRADLLHHVLRWLCASVLSAPEVLRKCSDVLRSGRHA